MTSRFISNLIVLLAAVTLVAFSLVFGPHVLAWLGFGLSCLVVIAILVAFAVRGRGLAQRAVDVLILFAGGWLIVASRTFSGAPLKWICFGTGALLACLALVGLTVHEISMELALRSPVRDRDGGWMRESVRERAPAR
jgi:hypothetical protein